MGGNGTREGSRTGLRSNVNRKREQIAWAKEYAGSGIRKPVDVTVFSDGGVGFTDGHHRVMAGTLLDIEIPVRVSFRNFDKDLWPDLLDLLKAGYTRREYNPQGWKLTNSGVPPLNVVRRGPNAADEWIMSNERVKTAARPIRLPTREIKELAGDLARKLKWRGPSAQRVASRWVTGASVPPSVQKAISLLEEKTNSIAKRVEASDRELVINFYRGPKMVGYFRVSDVSRMEIEDGPEDCKQAWKDLGEPTLWVVRAAEWLDKALIGKGLGALAYQALFDYVKSKRGVVGPDKCAGESTSPAAERVWERLRKKYRAQGPLIHFAALKKQAEMTGEASIASRFLQRKSGLMKMFPPPSERQKKQRGAAKVYYKQYYQKNRAKINRQNKARYRLKKNQFRFKRDREMRRDPAHERKFERKPGGRGFLHSRKIKSLSRREKRKSSRGAYPTGDLFYDPWNWGG